jgi:hypothetical protein
MSNFSKRTCVKYVTFKFSTSGFEFKPATEDSAGYVLANYDPKAFLNLGYSLVTADARSDG